MKKSLEDNSYELIKAHILDPGSSPLSPEKQLQLERIIDASKILEKNPLQKQAVALYRAKYPDVGRTQAYEDIRIAVRLFNTLHTFDFDFWHSWLINDIVKNIERCRNLRTAKAFQVIASEHANLIKAIGDKPEEIVDPRRNEKHAFYILVQNNNTQVKLDINNLHKLPVNTLQELNRALFAGKEITDVEAEEILNT